MGPLGATGGRLFTGEAADPCPLRTAPVCSLYCNLDLKLDVLFVRNVKCQHVNFLFAFSLRKQLYCGIRPADTAIDLHTAADQNP